MKTTRRRFWVYLLLLVFGGIAYVDRVNMSVAGKPIAHELGLSPVMLGYLFSSFLWAYVVMMLPGGRLIDRWGAHVVASVATVVWSAAQMATGAAVGVASMLLARLGLGIGEAPFSPVIYRSVRAWSPYTERGTATAFISAGGSLGPALGAPLVAYLIQTLSWRWSFVITGAIGFVWVAVWMALVSTPEKTSWLPEPERQRILAEREAGIAVPDHDGVGYMALLRCPAMWGLFVSQGCLVYSLYLYLSWLPNYLQTSRGLSLVDFRPLHFGSVFHRDGGEHHHQLGRRPAFERPCSAERTAPLSRCPVPVPDRRGLDHPLRRVTDDNHRLDIDHGFLRQCRSRGQRDTDQRSAAFAGRCRTRFRVSGPRRQRLRPACTYRHRISGGGKR